MRYLKTFSNGQRLEWQIEDDGAARDSIPQPIAYLDGKRVGVIWQCLNMDDDGNTTAPRVVGGKTIAAYFKHGAYTYCLVDGEFDALRAARAAAHTAKQERVAAEWVNSDAGKAEVERRSQERKWDALYNEGGDGYNPHRQDDVVTGTAFDPRECHYPEGA